MASFHAELRLVGTSYRVVRCHYACHQPTDARGRVNAKVRHDLLHLALDVPADDALLAWAADPFKPLAGEVVFYNATQLVALETIAFAAGQCVGYHESFESGAGRDGAYVCQLRITAPEFELRSGGPAAVATVMAAIANAPTIATAALPLVKSALSSAPIGALPHVAEYTLTDFAATIKGAEHIQPQSVITELYDLYHAASAASIPGKPSMPHWKALEDLMRSAYYDDPDDGKTKPLNGHWPPANGGYQRQTVQLKKGDVFDRYQGDVVNTKEDPNDPKNRIPLVPGDEFDVTFIGTFLSPMGPGGTPQSFESRALDRAENKYPFAYTVEIIHDVPLDVVTGELAQVIPWYGQPGGGTQMRVNFKDPNWSRQEWSQMQTQGYARINLTSAPSGQYAVKSPTKAQKIS